MVDDSDKPELKDPFDGLDSGEAAREKYFRETNIFGDEAARSPGPKGIARLKLSNIIPRAIEQWERRASGAEKPITTPWPKLNDAVCGGFWPGQSIVLAAEPGSGKTQWAMQLAVHVAQQGNPVVMVQLEASESEVAARLAAGVTNDSWSGLEYGQGGTAEIASRVSRIRERRAELESLPIYVTTPSPMDWDPRNNLDGIRALVREVAEEHCGRTPLLVLDYAQIAAMSRGATEKDIGGRIAEVCRLAKEVARSAGGVLLTISAVSRLNATSLREKRMANPDAGDAAALIGVGRETSELEYSADVMLALCPQPGSARVLLAVAKARGAGPSWVTLQFNDGLFD